ncbi:EamA family transporter [Patescibacteria group bacterium]
MSWILFSFISIFSSAIANLFQRITMKKDSSDPIVSSIIFQFTLAVLSGVFAFIKGFNMPPTELLFPNFLFSGICYGFGTITFFKAMKTIGASEKTILTGFGSLIVILTSFIFLKETLTPKQLLGVLVIILAILVVELKKEKISFSKGAKLALLGTTLYGFAVVNDSFILRSYDAISFMPVMSLIPGLILAASYPKSTLKLFNTLKRTDKNLWIYGFFYSIQGVAYYSAIETGGLVSQINTLFKTEIILTVLLATIFLKERRNLLRKSIGAALASIGVLLIK